MLGFIRKGIKEGKEHIIKLFCKSVVYLHFEYFTYVCFLPFKKEHKRMKIAEKAEFGCASVWKGFHIRTNDPHQDAATRKRMAETHK